MTVKWTPNVTTWRKVLAGSTACALFAAGAGFLAERGPSPASATVLRRASTPNQPVRATDIGFSQGSGLLWDSDGDLARQLDGMVAVGAGWVALDIDWPSIQPVGPTTWNWANSDRVIGAARSRGLQVLGTIAYSPIWARPVNTSDKHPPLDPAAYATFAGAVANRYASLGLHFWQLWNEPNVTPFYSPAPDPAGFAQLLIQAADAIHAQDPSAIVMNGGLAPAPNVAGVSYEPNTFLLMLYQNGVGGHLDAIGMHPYTFPWAPTTAATWNPLYMMGYTHLIMAAFGDGAKRIWATESGYGTGRDGESLDESTQALRFAELIAAWRQLPYAANLFVYGYRDTANNPSVVWDNMGLVRRDYSPKLAVQSFRNAALGLAHSTRARRCVNSGVSVGARRHVRSC